jgi:hypothetical protein
MLDLLGTRAVTLTEQPPADEDWYANLLWLDRQKCLLLTHAGTLFSVFVPRVRKADLRPIGPYVVKAVEAELRSESLPPDTLGQLKPDAVRLAKTASRSTLGFMNELAVHPSLPSRCCRRPQPLRHQRAQPSALPHLAQPRRIRLPDRTRRSAACCAPSVSGRRTHPPCMLPGEFANPTAVWRLVGLS